MIKQNILIFIIIFLNVLTVLSQNNTYENPNTNYSLDTGTVIFYTNAQALLNCGPFKVEIKINNKYAGIINKAYVKDFQPNCTNDSSVFLIKKVVGYYNYTAKIDCEQYGKWNGNFKVKNNSCTKIFLDIKNINLENY
jgi:hypothetical protein